MYLTHYVQKHAHIWSIYHFLLLWSSMPLNYGSKYSTLLHFCFFFIGWVWWSEKCRILDPITGLNTLEEDECCMWNTELQLTSFITTWHHLLFSPLPYRCAHTRRWPEVGALAQGSESTLWQCPQPQRRWEGRCFHSGLYVCFKLSIKCVERHEFWNDSTLSFQPLPDGVTHRYILPGASWAVSSQRAAVVDSIPFTHPTHVAGLLDVLRHQCAINALLRTCVASQHAKPETMECN